jgi:hypothetical protein
VLILGHFPFERKAILDAMRTELRKHDLVPILFDVSRSSQTDYRETIMVLTMMSQFIIVDITNPKAGMIELNFILPDYRAPIVPIIQQGERPFAMFADLQKFPWVMATLAYDSVASLIAAFDHAIVVPALMKRKELSSKGTINLSA